MLGKHPSLSPAYILMATPPLMHVAGTHAILCRALGLGQRRQQQARKNRNDGDYHQQFDQGKAGFLQVHTSIRSLNRYGYFQKKT